MAKQTLHGRVFLYLFLHVTPSGNFMVPAGKKAVRAPTVCSTSQVSPSLSLWWVSWEPHLQMRKLRTGRFGLLQHGSGLGLMPDLLEPRAWMYHHSVLPLHPGRPGFPLKAVVTVPLLRFLFRRETIVPELCFYVVLTGHWMRGVGVGNRGSQTSGKSWKFHPSSGS